MMNDIEDLDPLILNSLHEDPCKSHGEALLKIYQRLRPGNPPQLEKAVITKSGIGLQITFDTSTDKAGMLDSERPCSDVLDADTAASLGDGNLCLWQTDRLLLAKFGKPSWMNSLTWSASG